MCTMRPYYEDLQKVWMPSRCFFGASGNHHFFWNLWGPTR